MVGPIPAGPGKLNQLEDRMLRRPFGQIAIHAIVEGRSLDIAVATAGRFPSGSRACSSARVVEKGVATTLKSGKILGAVSHEIRNVCGAIAVVHENLRRSGALGQDLAQNKDFEALGTLITALEKIAAMDLRQTANQAAGIDLQSLLEELRIIVEPSFRDEGMEVHWDIEPGLAPVWADRQSLMQVFLNLTKNSERAMLEQTRRELRVTARTEKQSVVVRFSDSGCGVRNPDRLFRPFQEGAQATGLGLYLSRALMRSFRGDLRYEREPHGSCFTVELSPVLADEGKNAYGTGDPDSISRRPQPVSGEPQPVAGGRA